MHYNLQTKYNWENSEKKIHEVETCRHNVINMRENVTLN